ncbi:hypothetical protein ACLMJK_005743 [Lecanora helva]
MANEDGSHGILILTSFLVVLTGFAVFLRFLLKTKSKASVAAEDWWALASLIAFCTAFGIHTWVPDVSTDISTAYLENAFAIICACIPVYGPILSRIISILSRTKDKPQAFPVACNAGRRNAMKNFSSHGIPKSDDEQTLKHYQRINEKSSVGKSSAKSDLYLAAGSPPVGEAQFELDTIQTARAKEVV